MKRTEIKIHRIIELMPKSNVIDSNIYFTVLENKWGNANQDSLGGSFHFLPISGSALPGAGSAGQSPQRKNRLRRAAKEQRPPPLTTEVPEVSGVTEEPRSSRKHVEHYGVKFLLWSHFQGTSQPGCAQTTCLLCRMRAWGILHALLFLCVYVFPQ